MKVQRLQKVSTISERLQIAMDKRKIKQIDLAHVADVNQGALSRYGRARCFQRNGINLHTCIYCGFGPGNRQAKNVISCIFLVSYKLKFRLIIYVFRFRFKFKEKQNPLNTNVFEGFFISIFFLGH